MTEILKATELSVQEYVASIGLNPDNVFYQRIKSTNISTSRAEWQIISPNRRALLLSMAWIHWKPTITKVLADGITAANFVNNGVFASFKPGMPFTNAMSNIQSTVNSASLSISQPRRFMDHLNMMFAGRTGARNCFSGAGGGFPELNAFHTNADATVGLYTGYLSQDDTHMENEELFREKLNRANPDGNDLNGLNNRVIDCIEPVIIPPFNPFLKLKTGMPDYCWFKHMSAMIPNVSRLELSINFQNLSQSVLFPRYGRHAAANVNTGLRITNLSAELILYWYSPPISMVMPRQVSLNSWNVREYITSVSAGNVVNNNVTVTRVNTDLIQLHAVPTLIVIHAEVDKDSVNYSNIALNSDNDQAGGNVSRSGNNNALDSYMEISKFEVLLGDRPQVISTTFTQEELYYLTLKNSKVEDFPYSFQKWRGALIPTPEAGGTRYNQMSKCFLALRPKDISERFGDGVRFPTSLQFTMDLTARDGFHNLSGGNKRYKLYIHVYSGKHFLTMTSDSGQYQEQSIDVQTLTQQAGATLGSGLGGKLKLDDSRYQSRMPTF